MVGFVVGPVVGSVGPTGGAVVVTGGVVVVVGSAGSGLATL